MLQPANSIAIVLLACALFGAEFSHAQTSDNITLDKVDVYAGDIAQAGDVVLDEYTGSYQRIDRAQLERRDLTVADILAHESGVQSRQIGGFGTFSSITLRAATAAQTGIYLDGILLNSGGNAIVDLSLLDLFTVESADIYRGSTPAQLGQGSIGGAVNFNTPKVADGSATTKIRAGFGSFNTSRAQLSHSTRYGLWNLTGGVSVQRSDNNYRFTDNNGTPLNALDDTRQRRNNAHAQLNSALAKARRQWSDKSSTNVLLQATIRRLGIPEWRNSANNQAALDSDNLRLHLNHIVEGGSNWNSRTSLYIHDDDVLFDDRLSQIGLGPQLTDANSRTLGARSYWEYIGDASTTAFNLEYRVETQDASDVLDDDNNYSVQRSVLIASLQSALYFFDEKFLFTPGVRLQKSDDRYQRISRLQQASRSEQAINPYVGFKFTFSPATSFRANAGYYFREPSFSELFGSRGLIQGNNNLNPESGLNADFGISVKPNEHVSIDATLFGSWRDELIAMVFDARGVGRSVNYGRARIIGLETTTQLKLSDTLSARLNFTVQDAQSLNEFEAFNAKQLAGEAQQTGYLRVQYQNKPWTAFLETTGSWNRFYDQGNFLPAKDQLLQNLGMGWRHGRWKLTSTLTNLTNRNVEDFNGLLRPGRSFTLSLSTTL